MEKQQEQQLLFQKNGKHVQPSQQLYTTYTTAAEENKNEDLDLRQILAVMRRRIAVIGTVALTLSGAIWFWTLTRQPKYEGMFQLLVEPVTQESNLEGLTKIPGVSTEIQENGLDYETQIQVLQSPEFMAPVIKQLSTQYTDITYDSLFELESLQITRLEKTKILEVTYKDSDQTKIQFVLEKLAKNYLKYSLEERQTNLRQGIQFVDSQLPKLRSRVNSLQRELQQFRQQYDFIDPEQKGEKLSDLVEAVELQRLENQKQLAAVRQFYAALRSQLGFQIEPNSILNQNLQDQSGVAQALDESSVYQKLVTELRTLESQIAADSTRFQEDSPSIQALRTKRENLLPILRQEAARLLNNKLVEVENQIAGLEVQAGKITQAENLLAQQVKQLPTLARKYTDLQQELKIGIESLNRFLEKRESLQVENAQKEIPWQVIAAPQVPEDPISPNVQANIILGAIAGILAGIGAALLAERLDNVFHSPDDLKQATKLPILGLIPFYKELKDIATEPETTVETKQDGYKLALRNISNLQNETYFPFVEAFRSLHTNIGFLGSDSPIQSLVVSSTVKSDGKSTVSIHLAQAAASGGQRVLLVDADMRLPQVHHRLGLENDQGLSNVISTNLPVLDAIQRSPIWDNLYVLTSGPIPPDPIKLLSSKKMQNIMEQLRQEFDLVIYDTPPLLGLADSSIIATHTAGIVVVVRIGKTDRSVLMRGLDSLKISRANILGIVGNGVKRYHGTGYYYYNYYYHRSSAQGSQSQKKSTKNH